MNNVKIWSDVGEGGSQGELDGGVPQDQHISDQQSASPDQHDAQADTSPASHPSSPIGSRSASPGPPGERTGTQSNAYADVTDYDGDDGVELDCDSADSQAGDGAEANDPDTSKNYDWANRVDGE